MSQLDAIASYGTGAGSTRVRLEDWFRFLDLEPTRRYFAGLDNNKPRTIIRNLVPVAKAERAIRHLDVSARQVILSREATPFSMGEVEERLLQSSQYGVYDFDDAIFDEPSISRVILRTQAKCRRSVAAADIVIAGNQYLANWASAFSKNVRVIPSCVEPSDYQPKLSWDLTGPPGIVWLGSPGTEHYIEPIVPALKEINRQTGALLTLISGPRTNPLLAEIEYMMNRVSWDPANVAKNLNSADVGISPLDDSPYSRGKCAYKLLQYGATALPVVGSPIGANGTVLERFAATKVNTPCEWIEATLALLKGSAHDRELLGRSARAAVLQHYSFAAWETNWCDVVQISR